MRDSGSDAHLIHVPSARIFWVLWLVVTAWLVACAFLVNGEYGDGYLTIANSRYFFSDNPLYWLQRGPLAAIMLWPVEVLVELFNIGPFEVTPYHLYSAALHSIYLLGCWWALRTTGASPMARIIAFATAVTTVVFYGFAPYLSHDILPGLLFLLMIFIANRWLNKGGWRDAVLLVLIGTAVVLIKQTYALFWIFIVVYAGMAMLFRWDDGRVDWRRFGTLLGFAALSGVLTFAGYALFIGDDWGHLPWWIRPFAVVVSVTTTFSRSADLVFPADLYLRNLHNLGILAMLLVLPGVIYALRGRNARLRMIAVCWLMSAAVSQIVMFKEVRYVLFLAPLTALLIVPVIELALRKRALLIAMVLIVAVDQFRGFSVAANQLTATATIDPVRFFESAGTKGRVVASEIISFVYDTRSPLLRDSYHGIYHVSARVIFALQENEIEVYELDDTRKLGEADLQPGDRVYVANFSVRRFFPYTPDNSPGVLSEYIAVAGRAAKVMLRREEDGYVVDGYENSPVMLVPDPEVGDVAPLLSTLKFEPDQLESIYGSPQDMDTLEVTGIIVDAICRGDQCRYR
jgi:hypothetical protein